MGRGGQENLAAEATKLRGRSSGVPRVLVIRDPDYDTEIVAGDEVEVVEIDLGRSFDGLENMVAHLGEEEAIATALRWREEVAAEPADSPVRQRVEQLIEAAGLTNVPDPAPASDRGRSKPLLLAVRDPDYGMDYVCSEEVEVMTFDLGADFDGANGFVRLPQSEQDRFVDEQRERVADLAPDDPIRVAVEQQLAYLLSR